MRIETEIEKALIEKCNGIILEQVESSEEAGLTGAQLLTGAARFAAKVRDIGVQPGDRVILLGTTSIPAVTAVLGILQARATVVLLDPHLPPADLNRLIDRSDATALIAEENSVPPTSTRTTLPTLSLNGTTISTGGSRPPTIIEQDESIAFILYTSGTTAEARGVLLGHEAVIAGMRAALRGANLRDDDRNLCLLPICHVFGLVQNVLSGLAAGICTGLVSDLASPKLRSNLQRFQPTMISAVPLQLRHIQRLFPSDRTSSEAAKTIQTRLGGKLRLIATGGVALDPIIRENFLALNLRVIEGYGLSETAGAVYLSGTEDNLASDPCPGVELRIHNPNADGIGEIQVKGPVLFLGYFRDADATRKAMKDGWLCTGDLGTISEQGSLTVQGRLKETIITEGGKNVLPEEVEKHYRNIAGVADLAVYGQPTPSGDRIHVAIVPTPNANSETATSVADAIQHRAAHLPGHFRIARTQIVDKIPRNKAGKIRRHALAKHLDARQQPDAAEAPQTGNTFKPLMQILADLSDVEHVHPKRSFVDNGLDSLLAPQVATAIENRLGIQVSAVDFWKYSTPEKLAAHLDQHTVSSKIRTIGDEDNDAIAVIGLSCRVPGANDPAAFWQILVEGVNPIRPMSNKRQTLLGCTSKKSAGFVNDPDLFDPLFFRLSPTEADGMDPQQRLWLELCWEALAHSGIKPESLADTDTAVFAASGPNGYGNLLRRGKLHPTMNTGNAPAAMSGRVAYLLDLNGPCETVDTACSSSLVTIHRACRSLSTGECSLAVAGGVNLLLDMDTWDCLEEAGMLASDNACKTFDAAANGYVRGEGGGAVILQRLGDARRQGHRVLGIIRGSAVNQDGASNGFTAPSGLAQERLLRSALDQANLQPEDVDYLECHGTGTSLGDPIEVNAIQTVFGRDRERKPLLLGSAKSHVGHLETAAGITGFIKTLLTLSHRQAPKTLHFQTPNPLLNLSGLSISGQDQLMFPDPSGPARGGVSSFGFTGTNCHVILESGDPKVDLCKGLLPAPAFNKQSCWCRGEKAKEAADLPVEDVADDRCAIVCEIIEEKLRLEPGTIEPEKPLFHYGTDSLLMLEIVLKLEARFDCKLQPEALYDGIDTAAAVAEWIGNAPKNSAPKSPKTEAQPTQAKSAAPVLPVMLPGNNSQLTNQQQTFFDQFSHAYAKRTEGSKRQSASARSTVADQRAVSGFQRWKKEIVYPIHAASAKGSQITDVDANSYVDVAMEFGVNLFGHQPDFLREAVQKYLDNPLPLAVHNQLAGEVACAVAELTGCERVSFLCTGSEAVMAALRIARISTGRQRVAMFRWSYHGCHDQVLAHPGSDGSMPLLSGVNPGALEDVMLLDYGDPASLEVLRKEAGNLAAILVEPVQSRHPDLQPKAFLQALREISNDANTVLIFDEVITGFRCHAGGAQAYFGVPADLAVYGKIIGGGYPLAAVAGKSEIMNHVDGGPWQYGDTSTPEVPQTFVGGTYNGHPLALTAARAVLKQLRQAGPDLHEQLNARTKGLAQRLNRFFEQENLPLKVEQFSSQFRFICSGNDTDLFYAGLRHHGIYATEVRNCFLSAAHSEADVTAIEDAVKKTARLLRSSGFLTAPQGKPQPSLDRYVKRLGGATDPKLRLLCLTYAGGGVGPYKNWADHLPPEVEVLYLQLPGREALSSEPALEVFDEAIDRLAPAVAPYLDCPMVIFGHSMGATMAFEIARRYADHDNLVGLFVSGENAPHKQLTGKHPSALSDEALLEEANALGAGLTAEAAPFFLPRLRADLAICATYKPRTDNTPALHCPINVLGSNNDPLVPFSNLHEWQSVTTGTCTTHPPLQGGHFFIESDAENVRRILNSELNTQLNYHSVKETHR